MSHVGANYVWHSRVKVTGTQEMTAQSETVRQFVTGNPQWDCVWGQDGGHLPSCRPASRHRDYFDYPDSGICDCSHPVPIVLIFHEEDGIRTQPSSSTCPPPRCGAMEKCRMAPELTRSSRAFESSIIPEFCIRSNKLVKPVCQSVMIAVSL